MCSKQDAFFILSPQEEEKKKQNYYIERRRRRYIQQRIYINCFHSRLAAGWERPWFLSVRFLLVVCSRLLVKRRTASKWYSVIYVPRGTGRSLIDWNELAPEISI